MTELYKRLTEGYQYEVTEDGTQGQEVYIRHDDAAGGITSGSLPVVGSSTMLDPSGSAIASCFCRSKKAAYVGNDPSTIKWTFSYNTTKPAAGEPPGKHVNAKDPAARSYTLGGEFVTNESPEWYFISDGAVTKQPIGKIVVNGSFTIPKGPLTAAQNSTFWASVLGKIGTINSVAFEQFDIGTVLFEGIEGGNIYIDGVINYQYNMKFAFRYINDVDIAGAAIAQDDWLYVWRGSQTAAGKTGWDKVSDSPGGAQYLYTKTDLTTLL